MTINQDSALVGLMPLPAIRAKISSLPRSLKVLLPILFILILVIVAEGAYYFLIPRNRKLEVGIINKKGPKITVKDSSGNELDCIMGKIVKRENNDFTLEKDGQQIGVKIIDGALIYKTELREDMIPPPLGELEDKDKIGADELIEGKTVEACSFIKGGENFYATIVLVQK